MTIKEIVAALSERQPDSEASFDKPIKKTGKSVRLTYIPWHRAQRILGAVTEEKWDYEILPHDIRDGFYLCRVKVTIYADDGIYTRYGQGIEEMSTDSYGDPQSNAESMAFRRACAAFGLGLYLYEKEKRGSSSGSAKSDFKDSDYPRLDLHDEMPFGKHKGKAVRDLPKAYMEWWSGNKPKDKFTDAVWEHFLPSAPAPQKTETMVFEDKAELPF